MTSFHLYLDLKSRPIMVLANQTIYQAISQYNLDLNAFCGGRGTCGKCLIKCLSPPENFSPITFNERQFLTEDQIQQGFRLACQTSLKKDAKIQLTVDFNPTNYHNGQILMEDNVFSVDTDNAVETRTIDDNQGSYGIAFDLGTTTIVGYLVNKTSKKVIAQTARYNPQIRIGEDIINRIAFAAQSNDKYDQLTTMVKISLGEIVNDLLLQAPQIDLLQVSKVTIVGNTAMQQIIFGYDIHQLGKAPFLPGYGGATHISNKMFQLPHLSPSTLIYAPPIITGFMGGDTVADILACRQDLLKENTLLIDIGTNGELTLGNQQGITGTSVAAGPAFEGAQIKCGMRGIQGAIEEISLHPLTFQPTIKIIGDVSPRGICGSGIIDMVAELIRHKIITRSGNFNKNRIENLNIPRIRKTQNGYEFILHSSNFPAFLKKTSGAVSYHSPLRDNAHKDPREIVFTQQDVREVQKGKGAFLSGSLILLKKLNQTVADLDQIFIAGAFGTYLHKENAKFIGLFPDIPIDKIFQIGNAAGKGAISLLDEESEKLVDQIIPKIKHVNLAETRNFMTTYTDSMIFPHRNLEKFPSLLSDYRNIPFQ